VAENPKLTFAHDGARGGKYVVPKQQLGTLDYSTSDCATEEAKYLAELMAESLNIAAGPVNIFPLLGLYSQGSTIDQAVNGFPISSGTPSGYDAAAAFNVNDDSWRSVQQGAAVLTAPAYIGYNFGTKKVWDGSQERYVPAEPVRKKIGTLKIRQGVDSRNRATQVRVEASDNGTTWHRVDVVTLPDSSALETVGIQAVAEYAQWRFIPTFFNGVASNFQWEVVEMHLLEETQVTLNAIEDYIFLENRDRSYAQSSTMIKCSYDLLDVQSELAKFGINLPQTYIFTCAFSTMVGALGRPVVVGDIVELPGEVQYDANLRPVRKWLEVTDAGWSTEGYTPDWKPQLYRFYAQPVNPSAEHQDILGLPGVTNSNQSDDSILKDGFLSDDLGVKVSQAVSQASKEASPQLGQDSSGIASGKPLVGKPGEYDGNDLYAEDAIPPDNATYTIGDTLPLPSTISDGHYHRQTYALVPQQIRPPDRLLQWNATTARWIVRETNIRSEPTSHKRTIAKMIASDSKHLPDQKL